MLANNLGFLGVLVFGQPFIQLRSRFLLRNIKGNDDFRKVFLLIELLAHQLATAKIAFGSDLACRQHHLGTTIGAGDYFRLQVLLSHRLLQPVPLLLPPALHKVQGSIHVGVSTAVLAVVVLVNYVEFRWSATALAGNIERRIFQLLRAHSIARLLP